MGLLAGLAGRRNALRFAAAPPGQQDATGGLLIEEQRPGFSRCSLKVAENHFNSFGVVHGGVLFTMADTGMGSALFPHLKEGERFATIEVKINYFKPVRAGTIVCVTEVIHLGKSIANLESSLSVEGVLVAKANGSYAIAGPRTANAP